GARVPGRKGEGSGLVRPRDRLCETDPSRPVDQIITPREKLISAEPGASMESAREKLHSHRLEKLPVFDGVGELRGLITAQDIIKLEQWPHATKDERGRLRVAAAVGVRESDLARPPAGLHAGADAP